RTITGRGSILRHRARLLADDPAARARGRHVSGSGAGSSRGRACSPRATTGASWPWRCGPVEWSVADQIALFRGGKNRASWRLLLSRKFKKYLRIQLFTAVGPPGIFLLFNYPRRGERGRVASR